MTDPDGSVPTGAGAVPAAVSLPAGSGSVPAADGVSVLMAVYARDQADWVRATLLSLVEQTRPAEQVVIVQDGPVADELTDVLSDFADRLPIEILRLANNQGLGPALQAGLAQCRYDLVARVDADDINEPTRLQAQAQAMMQRPELAVLGGYVAEFIDDPAQPYAVRTVVTGAQEVARLARWRSPVNHPTVMMRRSQILAVGGYDRFIGLEDYYLWGKLLASGRTIDNLPVVLVRMRAGAALSGRRGGWTYARAEAQLLWAFVGIGFLTRRQALVGLVVRVPVRLLPDAGRHWFYRHILRRRIGAGED